MRDTLKFKRLLKGLTQKDVAEKIGVSVQFYSMLEKGQRGATDRVWAAIKDTVGLTDIQLARIKKESIHR